MPLVQESKKLLFVDKFKAVYYRDTGCLREVIVVWVILTHVKNTLYTGMCDYSKHESLPTSRLLSMIESQFWKIKRGVKMGNGKMITIFLVLTTGMGVSYSSPLARLSPPPEELPEYRRREIEEWLKRLPRLPSVPQTNKKTQKKKEQPSRSPEEQAAYDKYFPRKVDLTYSTKVRQKQRYPYHYASQGKCKKPYR